jgi:hypothetical protein
MDNYFILSFKVGDKWTKVTYDMTSVKLGTCIHIVGDFSLGYLMNGGTTIIMTITFHKEFTVISKHT